MSILDKNIFILTGAGISKESGINTFRDKDGLWDNYKIEDVCTVDAFKRNPELVNNFYNERKKKMKIHKLNQTMLIFRFHTLKKIVGKIFY